MSFSVWRYKFRVVNGLGRPTGWVGLGWVGSRFFLAFLVDWVGSRVGNISKNSKTW